MKDPAPPKGIRRDRLFRAALAWWRSHRPLTYDCQAHLRNPTVNSRSPEESALAEEVARRLRMEVQRSRPSVGGRGVNRG